MATIQKTSPNLITTKHRRVIGWAIAVIIFMIIVGFLLKPLIKLPLPSRSQTQSFLQQKANLFQFPGELVYENIHDNGCGPNPTSWLGSLPMYRSCTLTMGKYFRHKGSQEQDLRQMDMVLRENGWKPRGGIEDFLVGRNSGSHDYLLPTDGDNTYILRIFVPDHSTNTYASAKEFIGTDQDITLQPGEYVYGVRTVRGYGE